MTSINAFAVTYVYNTVFISPYNQKFAKLCSTFCKKIFMRFFLYSKIRHGTTLSLSNVLSNMQFPQKCIYSNIEYAYVTFHKPSNIGVQISDYFHVTYSLLHFTCSFQKFFHNNLQTLQEYNIDLKLSLNSFQNCSTLDL